MLGKTVRLTELRGEECEAHFTAKYAITIKVDVVRQTHLVTSFDGLWWIVSATGERTLPISPKL